MIKDLLSICVKCLSRIHDGVSVMDFTYHFWIDGLANRNSQNIIRTH